MLLGFPNLVAIGAMELSKTRSQILLNFKVSVFSPPPCLMHRSKSCASIFLGLAKFAICDMELSKPRWDRPKRSFLGQLLTAGVAKLIID